MKEFVKAVACVIAASVLLLLGSCSFLMPQTDFPVDSDSGEGNISDYISPPSGNSDTSASSGESGSPVSEQTEVLLIDNSYRFTIDNMPSVDGSSAMLSLFAAMENVLLGIPMDQAADEIRFHNNSGAYGMLINGEADLILVTMPSSGISSALDSEGINCDSVPFAREGLVFYVNENNPVDSLTVDELRGIYDGSITNWSEVGGEDIDIVPFSRQAGAGSAVFFEELIGSGDVSEDLINTETESDVNEEPQPSVCAYDNSPGAIGYSLFHYYSDMNTSSDGIKIISVNGVAPSVTSISDGSYPLTDYYYAVIREEMPDDSPARILRDWLLSSEGQSLVRFEQYVPIEDIEEEDDV